MTTKTEITGGVQLLPGGIWHASITAPDQSLHDLGDFATHEAARAAYIAKYGELYPPDPPVKVDPAKHHVLTAADLHASMPDGGPRG